MAVDTTADYQEKCTVAIAHLSPGRGLNEDNLTESCLTTLRRAGYQAGTHELWGFGAPATGLSSIPAGMVVTLIRTVHSSLSGWIKRRRQKKLEAHFPLCVVQLVVSGQGRVGFGIPGNLGAGVLAVLPTLLADLRAESHCRRFEFWIYTTSPRYSQLTLRIRDEDVKLKYLVRMIRLCERAAQESNQIQQDLLGMDIRKNHWWTPKRVHIDTLPARKSRRLFATSRINR